MKEIILQKLKQIEEDNDCKILFAIESGSRAWGFESTDSDYDVRFVYIRKMDSYLSIKDPRDVIELPVNDVLDINGWDIKKTLKLLKKTNPSLLEWIVSDTVYMNEFGFKDFLKELLKSTVSLKGNLYHYMNMAKNNLSYLSGDQVKIKKYFYVLRPIFACLYITNYKEIPPIKFQDLMKYIEIPDDVRNEIKHLLERKISGVELGIEPQNVILNKFISEKLIYIQKYIEECPLGQEFQTTTNNVNLDEIFRKFLKDVWM